MGLKELLFPKTDHDRGGQEAAAYCPNGHVLDPGWNGVCPYCAGTSVRTSVQPPESAPPMASSANDRRTSIGGPPPSAAPASGGRRETKVDSSDPAHVQRSSGDSRRITGVLATFSWTSTGQIFEIREGKNFIGAGNLSDDSHRSCDVLILTDPELSREHALILCRQGKYELLDRNSSNGTFLDGQMIPTHGAEIPNNARIKVGSTVFQFLMIDHRHVPGQPAMPAPSPSDEQGFDSPPPHRRGLTDIA